MALSVGLFDAFWWISFGSCRLSCLIVSYMNILPFLSSLTELFDVALINFQVAELPS